jgi:hypothetical protein
MVAVQPHLLLLVGRLRLFLHDYPRHFHDGLADPVLGLGTDLEPLDIVFLQKIEMLLRNGSFFASVALVDETVDAVIGRVLLGFFHPVSENVLEGSGDSDIIDQNDSIGSFIVRLSNASKSLLASSIPNLQFDIAIIDVHRST